jgi:hypothetical protein
MEMNRSGLISELLNASSIRRRALALSKALRGGLNTCCLLVLVLTIGCRQAPTTVSGAVTLDGKLLSVRADQHGKVIFQRVDGHGALAAGTLDPSGHFHLATGSSFEVAPGEYQVAISVSEPLPMKENAESSAKLITPVRFSSTTDSGLRANVKSGENVFSFDLAVEQNEGGSTSPATSPASPEPKGAAQESN